MSPVYENGTVYLQNTSYDSKIFATIDYGTHKVEHSLVGDLMYAKKDIQLDIS